MTKDSPLTVAGAAAELGSFPAPHSLLIPKTGTVGNYGRSLSKSKSIPPRARCDPHWTSALFLPHEHACLSSCTGAGKPVRGRSMSVEAVTVTNEDAARRRIGATAALAALVALLVLISLGIGPVRLSPLTVMQALFGGGSEVSQVIVREIRLPRTLLALAIGAILGLSGAALQGLLRNPLASPVAVRRAAIGRLRRGAGDRAGAGRCALLCAAGRGDHRRVRLGVRAADDRRPQCRAADPDSRRAWRSRALRALPRRW